ncbi:UNVERIFIED_CONTAM: hypothetical protein HHA_205120 [Hammondia hammondi]|eukprot:XP_008887438.1 hypothetical protein HHA_205120 [Hammondia hammondi]
MLHHAALCFTSYLAICVRCACFSPFCASLFLELFLSWWTSPSSEVSPCQCLSVSRRCPFPSPSFVVSVGVSRPCPEAPRIGLSQVQILGERVAWTPGLGRHSLHSSLAARRRLRISTSARTRKPPRLSARGPMETARVSPWGGSVLFIALGTWGDVLPLFSVALHLFDAGLRATLPASHAAGGSRRRGRRRRPEAADRPGVCQLVPPADVAREDAGENGGREGAVNADKTRVDVRTREEESERRREGDKPQSSEQEEKKEHGEDEDKRAGRSSQERRLLARAEDSCALESSEREKKPQKAKGDEEEEGHAQEEITEEEVKGKRSEKEKTAWERRRNTEDEEANHLRRTKERQKDGEQNNRTVILEIIFATHECWIKPLIDAFSPISPVYSSPLPSSSSSSSSFPASSFRVSSCGCAASLPVCVFECTSAEEAYRRRLAGGEDLVRLLSALGSSRQKPPLTLSSSVLSIASRVRFSFVSLPSPPLRASAAALFHPGELEPLLTVLCGSASAARSSPTSAESASPPCATVSDRCTPPSLPSPQLSPLQSSSPRPASLSSVGSPATPAPFALCVCSSFGVVWLHAAEKAGVRCLLLVPSPRLALRAPPPGLLEALQEEVAGLGEEVAGLGEEVAGLGEDLRRRRGETLSLLQWAVDRVGGARQTPTSLEDLRLWQWRLCLADHGQFRETFLSLPASLFDPPNDCHPAASPLPCPLPASPSESTSSPSSSSSSQSSSSSSQSSSSSSSSSFAPFRPLSVPVVFLLDAWLFPEVAKSLPASACVAGAADAPWRKAMDVRSLCRDLRRHAPSRSLRLRRDRRLSLFPCLSLSAGSTALAFYGDEGTLLASLPDQREHGRTERFRDRDGDREAREKAKEDSCAGGRTRENWPGDKVERSLACPRRPTLRFDHLEAASRCHESAHSRGADASTARGETPGEAKRFRRRGTRGGGRCVSERDTKKTQENAYSQVENFAEIERENARQEPHSDETDALRGVAKLPQGGRRGGCSRALKEVENVEKQQLIYVSFGSMHASEINLLPSPQTLIRVLARVGVALDARVILHIPFPSFAPPHTLPKSARSARLSPGDTNAFDRPSLDAMSSLATSCSRSAVSSSLEARPDSSAPPRFSSSLSSSSLSASSSSSRSASSSAAAESPGWRVAFLRSLVDLRFLLPREGLTNVSVLCLLTHGSAGAAATFAPLLLSLRARGRREAREGTTLQSARDQEEKAKREPEGDREDRGEQEREEDHEHEEGPDEAGLHDAVGEEHGGDRDESETEDLEECGEEEGGEEEGGRDSAEAGLEDSHEHDENTAEDEIEEADDPLPKEAKDGENKRKKTVVCRRSPAWLVFPFFFDQPAISARLASVGLASVASPALLDALEQLVHAEEASLRGDSSHGEEEEAGEFPTERKDAGPARCAEKAEGDGEQPKRRRRETSAQGSIETRRTFARGESEERESRRAGLWARSIRATEDGSERTAEKKSSSMRAREAASMRLCCCERRLEALLVKEIEAAVKRRKEEWRDEEEQPSQEAKTGFQSWHRSQRVALRCGEEADERGERERTAETRRRGGEERRQQESSDQRGEERRREATNRGEVTRQKQETVTRGKATERRKPQKTQTDGARNTADMIVAALQHQAKTFFNGAD